MSSSKLYLTHGDSDYLIFKEVKALKKKLLSECVGVSEIFPVKTTTFDEIQGALISSDLFLSSNAVILREVTDSRSFYPYVEDLVKYIDSGNLFQNELYLFNSNKVLKTSKLIKSITKAGGKVKELNQPKQSEVLDMIHKSINIHQNAALLLYEYTGSNLFQIKSEIDKLKNYIIARSKDKVEPDDVEEICIKSFSVNDVW